MRIVLTFFFLTFSFLLIAQEDDDFAYVQEDHNSTKNGVYEDGIHTVLFGRGGNTSVIPYIQLGGNGRLKLSFDDFSMRQDDINYQIYHCEADWTISDIQYHYYASGVQEGFILDYDYSRAMNQRYIHYELEVPNDEMKIIASGNYLLKVYRNGKPDQTILTKRFYVTEERVVLSIDIHPAFDPMYRTEKQEIDFSILHENYQIINPDKSLKVVLLQNQRWDNAITGLKPLFIQNNELSYNYDGKNAFWGGNEYRCFDIRNFNIRGENIEGYIKRIDTMHVFLEKAERKKQHNSMDAPNNIFGGVIIGSSTALDKISVDADYAMVYFYILSDYRIASGDFYAFGALSNFEHDDRSRYKYNEKKKRYELQMYLKQGKYNWHHHFVKHGSDVGDVKSLEKTYAITKNQYTILVYHRPLGEDFDRLIKVSINTFPNFNQGRNE